MWDKMLAIVQQLADFALRTDNQLLDELSQSDDVPLDVARAVLLVDLALIDQNFDSREYEVISAALQRDLAIDKQAAEQLIKAASEMVQFRGSHSFAAELQRRLDPEARSRIMSAVQKLIAADQVEDDFEKYLEKKFRDILGA